MRPLEAVLIALALPVLSASAYLLVLALFSARLRPPAPVEPRLRLAVVVPAHDEAALIGRTVKSLLATAYPAALRRVVVVADNCTDETAARAREAGAEVLVRDDPGLRGKGRALAFAFADPSLKDAEAVVVVDADTVVSPNLLQALAARLAAGATACQADYGIDGGTSTSWRTTLLAVAFATFHRVRSLGRERLGLSCGLRGNGMCFSARLLREVPYRAFSVVEDLEYGLDLGEAGHRVHYVPEAQVLGEAAPTAGTSGSQRRRWEGGRRAIAAKRFWPLLSRAIARRDRVLLDLALDLAVPPLSTLLVLSAAGVATSAIAGAGLAGWVWSVAGLLVVPGVVRGWWLSGTGVRGLAALAMAPLYVLWKLTLVRLRRRSPQGEWVRTARAGEVR